MIALVMLLACRGGVQDVDVIDHTHTALVDDFRVFGLEGEDLGRSRLDTARTFVGSVGFDRGLPALNQGEDVMSGVRFQLPTSPAQLDEGLPIDALLGPLVDPALQLDLVGIRVRVDGSGELTAHLDGPDGTVLWSETKSLKRRAIDVLFEVDLDPASRVSTLALDLGRGFAELREVQLLLQERRPLVDVLEEAYVFSFAQLARCWDDEAGLARVRCTPDGTNTIYGPDVTGLFALAAAVGHDVGIVEEQAALRIVSKARDALLALPRDPTAGLLPERTNGTGLIAGSRWGTLSTVIALDATMLAAEHFELPTAELQNILATIDWTALTAPNRTRPILAGYDDDGVALAERYGVFGSKSALLQIAHVAATGEFAAMEYQGQEPTFDGSGWDNELASLLFPMTGSDWLDNDWLAWRTSGHWQHYGFTQDTPAGERGLFGLSLAEVPEPWFLEEFDTSIGVFGVGGHNSFVADGSAEVGYAFFAPHYPAMTAAEFPDTATTLFTTLIDDEAILTPLNAVESVGLDAEGVMRHNHRLHGFTLAMQTLGLSRAYAAERYLPYRTLESLPFLQDGLDRVLPEANE